MPGDPTYWRLRPRAPMPGTVLGPLDEIPECTGREYLFGRGKSAFSMFVIRKGERVWGYLNICPHFSLPLNYRAGEFMNEDGSLIRCSMHFAEFRIEDGFCVAGAAENCFLDPVPVHVDAERRVVIDDATPASSPAEDGRTRSAVASANHQKKGAGSHDRTT